MSSGKHIPVKAQISVMSADEWEEFIEEWMTTKSAEYFSYEKLGGAGDQGRDVVGYKDNPVGQAHYLWDNYQCKHYKAPLMPNNIWVEVGKMCYFSYIGEYPFPRKYYFVSPLGIGTKLSNFLKKPEVFKLMLIENWDDHCKEKITDTKSIDLTVDLKKYIESLDFSVFDKISVLQLIIDHSKTQFHVMRFNTPLPPRPDTPRISDVIGNNEINYVKKLILAYNSHCDSEIKDIESVNKISLYKKHLQRSREDFLHAETLRNFSRESLPIGEFESVQGQILNGILDVVESDEINGFDKVKKAVSEAKKLQLPINPLSACITVNDRGGICHQLANDDRLSWCNPDE